MRLLYLRRKYVYDSKQKMKQDGKGLAESTKVNPHTLQADHRGQVQINIHGFSCPVISVPLRGLTGQTSFKFL